MGNTDFIDEDLIQPRDRVKEVNVGPAREVAPASEPPKAAQSPELNLTPLAQRKEEINSQMASKLDELERLRARQEALEKEKSSLENLRANQEKYEAGKREMVDHLEKSLISMEREDVALNQRLALLTDTSRRFKDMLKELREFREDQWPTDSAGLRDELNRTLTVIDNIRKEYNRSCARLEAIKESKSQEVVSQMVLDEADALARQKRSFWDWFKIGLAASLPLILVVLALIAVIMTRTF